MSNKIRVHELAKKHKMKNKEFISLLHEMGIDVSSHLSGVTEEEAHKIDKEVLSKKKVEDKTGSKSGKNKKNLEAKEMVASKKRQEPAKNSNSKQVKEHSNPKKDTPSVSKPEKTQTTEKQKPIKMEKVDPEEEIKIVKINNDTTLGEFSEKLGVKSADIIKKLFLKGQMVTINSVIPFELAEEIAEDEGVLLEEEVIVEEDFGEKFSLEIEDDEKDLEERAPVITIMGHVDHGKTSLLDALRETAVADDEAGGITQKIGAYQVDHEGKKITFIDTPGHEAFTEMRARGARITDIAILIVAADDGVMPQTEEAISHAKEAGVPIIVAINKIDKPDANPEKIKHELMEHNLIPAELGGDIETVEISAKNRTNLDELLEIITLTAELLEIKANKNKRAKGVVIESKLHPQMGPIADILVLEGTLKISDVFVLGDCYGKVRALINAKGQKVKHALPAEPIEVMGFSKVPGAGDLLYVIRNEKQAKKIVEEVKKTEKIKEQRRKKHVTLDELHDRIEKEKLQSLKLIIKADSKGSMEALKDTVQKQSNEEVSVDVIHASTGAVTEGDVKLAEASDAIIIGFNVRPTTKARNEAEKESVEIRTYNIIYRITDDLKNAIQGMLAPEFKEVYLGRVEIKKIFKISKLGNIAGCVVIDGKIKRDAKVRVLRNGIITNEGELSSLKRFTDDVNEVTSGTECGLTIENFNDIKEADIIEAYTFEEVQRTLD